MTTRPQTKPQHSRTSARTESYGAKTLNSTAHRKHYLYLYNIIYFLQKIEVEQSSYIYNPQPAPLQLRVKSYEQRASCAKTTEARHSQVPHRTPKHQFQKRKTNKEK